MHDCPCCSETCDCDGEDHWQDAPDDCQHQCPAEADDEETAADPAREGSDGRLEMSGVRPMLRAVRTRVCGLQRARAASSDRDGHGHHLRGTLPELWWAQGRSWRNSLRHMAPRVVLCLFRAEGRPAMSRDKIALRIFCALMTRAEATIDIYPTLGEKQIKTCFVLADTFLQVAASGRPRQPDKSDGDRP